MSIVWNRYWPLGTKIALAEDRLVEFKNHWYITEDQVSRGGIKLAPISACICGFLNQGQSGKVFLGIRDPGYISGLRLTPEQMDHLATSVENALDRFSPQVPEGIVNVTFVPVLSKQECVDPKSNIKSRKQNFKALRTSADDDQLHELGSQLDKCWCHQTNERLRENDKPVPVWIVEIEIKKSSGFQTPLKDTMEDVPKVTYFLNYENEQRCAYLRLDAVTRKMYPFDISRHMNDAVRRHYEKIRADVKTEIDEKIEALGVKNEMKVDFICNDGKLGKQFGRAIRSDVQRLLS